jgi:glycerophosphoryl diester phosphodiesterase
MLGRARPRPRYQALSVPVRHRGLPVATRRFVAAARRLGCPVHVWTVNDAATARRLWARGVAGVVTNVPDVIRPGRP